LNTRGLFSPSKVRAGKKGYKEQKTTKRGEKLYHNVKTPRREKINRFKDI